MKSVRWMASYILVASFGLWLAFFVSMKFMTPAHSQEAPAAGDLPPEFMKDIESNPPTAAPSTPDANTTAPAQNRPQNAPSVPSAEGYSEQPIGDGMTAPQFQGGSGDEYVYDPTGKRDPFKPFRDLGPVPDKGGAPAKQGGLEPLQRWDLDRLQVVGILWEVKRPRAMLRDPDGAVYTIVKNSRVGRNEGVVTAIREGEVVIIETLYIDGTVQKEPRVLEFKK